MPPGSNCHQIWGMTCEPWRYITLFLYGCILLANIASTCLFEELSEQKNQTHRPTLAAVLYMSTSQVLLLPLLEILSNRYNKHNMYLPTQSSAKDLLWFNDFVRRTVPGIIFFKWWCCEELLEKPKKSLRFVYMDKILYYSYDIMDARSRTVGMYI